MLEKLLQPPWPKILTATGLITIVFSALVFLNSLNSGEGFLSPLVEHLPFIGKNPQAQRLVYGFLPFWNLKYEANFRYQLLTHLAFFGLSFDGQGNLRTHTPEGTIEPGWSAYQGEVFGRVTRQARQHGVKIVLVLAAMDQSSIEGILTNKASQARLLNHLYQAINLKNLDGINIDFEYAGSSTPQLQLQFTRFIDYLSQNLKSTHPHLQISLDVFADAAIKPRVWDLPALAPLLDHIIIMAYDFHRPSSPIAGPIAPLRGGCLNQPNGPCLWELDVTQSLTAFTKLIPPQKLVLGIPYYGYGWHTTSPKIGATTYPDSGELATYQRIQKILGQSDTNITNISSLWDPLSLTPYLTYKSSGHWHQIWFEDERSLKLKFDLVNQTNLAGVAIWALGYDGNHSELWQLLKSLR